MATKIGKPGSSGSSHQDMGSGSTENQEHRNRGVKIQVGSYASSAVRKQTVIEKPQISQGSSSSAATTSTTGKAASVTSSTTMYDLCDRSYSLKYCKKDKKKKDHNSVEEKSSNETRNKIMISLNSGSMHHSALAMRAKEQNDGGGPRVEIVNGKIVVKESSLMVAQDLNNADGDYEEVVEGNHATATYSSFLKTRHAFSWGIEETRMFYQSLRQCGTEFSIMQSFFPGRTRKQLKAKFFREEKQHPELVKRALSTSLPLEINPFEPSKTEKTATSSSSTGTAHQKRKRSLSDSIADNIAEAGSGSSDQSSEVTTPAAAVDLPMNFPSTEIAEDEQLFDV